VSEPTTAGTTAQDRFQTQYTETDMRCMKCSAIWSPPVANVVNVGTHPQAREAILRKTMHQTRCPVCKRPIHIDHIFEYYDPDENLLVQVRMDWEFKAGGGEEVYWKRLDDLVMKHQDDDVRVDVVFGFDEMIEKYLGGQAAVDEAVARHEREVAEGKPSGSIATEMAEARRAQAQRESA
jgi:hypothetical protein